MVRKVKVEQGELQGIFGWDPRVTVFKGVPYAKPPIGENRWRAPQPPEKWEGVRVADHYGPIAMQSVPGSNPKEFWTREIHPTGTEWDMSEDCLYVNIFTAAETPDDNLPVLFYIHGGGYQGGYPHEVEFDWEHMAKKGIVVVAVTYRLGVFGFLAHPELSAEAPDMPKGNFGIHDQIFAIEWVKRNIKAFGGDPTRITIAGQSAGAGSVQCILASPMAKGLISGAIIESGVAGEFAEGGRRRYTAEDAEKTGVTFFENAGIKSLAEARSLPAEKIMELTRTAFGGFGFRFMPTIDGILSTETAFEAYLGNRHHDVPIIAGYNLGEARGFMRFGKPASKMEQFDEYAKRFGDKEEEFRQIANVKTDEDVEKLFDSDAFTGLIAATRMFGYISNSHGRRAYLYEFNADIPGEDNAGSYHGAEMWFAYDGLGRCWRPFRGKHYDLARQMSSYWANFVKNGDPNGVDTIGDPLPEWESFTPDNQFVMGFTDAPAKNDTVTDDVLKFRIYNTMGKLD